MYGGVMIHIELSKDCLYLVLTVISLSTIVVLLKIWNSKLELKLFNQRVEYWNRREEQ